MPTGTSGTASQAGGCAVAAPSGDIADDLTVDEGEVTAAGPDGAAVSSAATRDVARRIAVRCLRQVAAGEADPVEDHRLGSVMVEDPLAHAAHLDGRQVVGRRPDGEPVGSVPVQVAPDVVVGRPDLALTVDRVRRSALQHHLGLVAGARRGEQHLAQAAGAAVVGGRRRREGGDGGGGRGADPGQRAGRQGRHRQDGVSAPHAGIAIRAVGFASR